MNKINIKSIPLSWVWLIIAVVVLIFSFYWFSVRPEQIKKECYKKASVSNTPYRGCLLKNGLDAPE
jgi:hypothetical protein